MFAIGFLRFYPHKLSWELLTFDFPFSSIVVPEVRFISAEGKLAPFDVLNEYIPP